MIVGSEACQADVVKVMELMVRETQQSWENAVCFVPEFSHLENDFRMIQIVQIYSNHSFKYRDEVIFNHSFGMNIPYGM